MLNISADIEKSRVWDEIERVIAAGNFPHAFAVRSAENNHFEIVLKVGKLLLGNLGWIENRHPDLLFAGENSLKSKKPPSIEECREFMNELSLLPVISSRRLGIIMYADQLLLPAANSLLKITEEPPLHVNLLFMMQDDTLLPTLRSRVRSISILTDSFADSDEIPDSDSEWLKWEKNVKEITDIVYSLEKWRNYALEKKNAELAFKI